MRPTSSHIPTMELVRELAALEPAEPVLSIYLRTDPRDPANTAQTPGWLVALRNGLRDLGGRLEADGPRDEKLAMRDLHELVEKEILELSPHDRARGLTWFITPDGNLDRRLSLQIPPRDNVVRWDERPYVSPLIDVADRGRPTGIILVAGDAVRLLDWEAGHVFEPDNSLFELELGSWRPYSGYASNQPGRGQQTVTHTEAYERRVEDWRDRFLREAAIATGARLRDLAWDRVLIASDGKVASRFAADLPDHVRERVIAEVEANLLWEEPAAVSERLEPELDAVWARECEALANRAVAAAAGGGDGVSGWAEVLDMLMQGRVEHLVFDATATPDPNHLPGNVLEALGSPTAEMIVERAVERAIASGGAVTAVPAQSTDLLAEVGGVAATLRY